LTPVVGLSALLRRRRGHSEGRRNGGPNRARRSTVVPPGLTRDELAMLAGTFMFHRSLTRALTVPLRTENRLTALLWRAVRLVILADRGAGATILADLSRCAAAVDAYERSRIARPELRSTIASLETDGILDEELDRFLTGPSLALDLLVDRVVPELPSDTRRRFGEILENLLRDLAEQLGFARSINP
jgi:hypothetical protein